MRTKSLFSTEISGPNSRFLWDTYFISSLAHATHCISLFKQSQKWNTWRALVKTSIQPLQSLLNQSTSVNKSFVRVSISAAISQPLRNPRGKCYKYSYVVAWESELKEEKVSELNGDKGKKVPSTSKTRTFQQNSMEWKISTFFFFSLTIMLAAHKVQALSWNILSNAPVFGQ